MASAEPKSRLPLEERRHRKAAPWRRGRQEPDHVPVDERDREVDFVVKAGRSVVAIEVKSGRAPQAQPGMAAFDAAFKPRRTLLVGGDGLLVEQFLRQPVAHWLD